MANDTDPTWPPSIAEATTEPTDGLASGHGDADAAKTDPSGAPVAEGDDAILRGLRRHRAPPKINPKILADSDGDTAAAYYAGPRELNTRVDTPPPEPAVEVFVTSPLPMAVVPAGSPPAEPGVAAGGGRPVTSDYASSRAETFVVRPPPRRGAWMMLAIIGVGTAIAALILGFGESSRPARPSQATPPSPSSPATQDIAPRGPTAESAAPVSLSARAPLVEPPASSAIVAATSVVAPDTSSAPKPSRETPRPTAVAPAASAPRAPRSSPPPVDSGSRLPPASPSLRPSLVPSPAPSPNLHPDLSTIQ